MLPWTWREDNLHFSPLSWFSNIPMQILKGWKPPPVLEFPIHITRSVPSKSTKFPALLFPFQINRAQKYPEKGSGDRLPNPSLLPTPSLTQSGPLLITETVD